MKVFSLLFSVFCCFLSTATAQRIPKSKPVIVKATSTECNVCGMRFWDEFKEIKSLYEKDAVLIAAHPLELSQLYTNTSEVFISNMSQFWGTPSLYLNSDVVDGYWMKATKDFVALTQQKETIATPFIDYRIVDNSIQVTVKTQFFKRRNRAQYLAIYVLEDDLQADQSNRGPEDLHSKVLRTHLGENIMGTLLSDETIEAGQEFYHEFALEMDPTWVPENLEIAAILYEKSGDKFTIINAEAALEPANNFSTSLNVLEAAQVKLTAQPNLIADHATVQLDLPQSFKQLDLKVVNAAGQTILPVFNGDLTKGQHTFDLNRTQLETAGLYFLVLEKEGSRIVEKIVVR